jgi:aldose 1-epimerase
VTPDIVTLRDPNTLSTARVLANFGFNCYRFTAVVGREEVDVLWAEEGFETGSRRPSGSGTPILFPFPGRIAGTTLEFQGRRYQLQAGDKLGNAIHGFVLNRPWRVIERSEAHAIGEFHAAVDEPSLRDAWPGDFRIRVAYRLSGNALSIDAVLDNPGSTPLPMGFGLHPYFRVPLSPAGHVDADAAAACRVRVPAAEYWELVDMIATGRRLPSSDRGPLAAGMEFDQTRFDDVFTGLSFDGDWCAATIEDPASGRSVRIEFDRAFRECVVYNPPHREAICIEPYTCVPGAIELARRGVDAGLRVLAPGESMTARVRISVE